MIRSPKTPRPAGTARVGDEAGQLEQVLPTDDHDDEKRQPEEERADQLPEDVAVEEFHFTT